MCVCVFLRKLAYKNSFSVCSYQKGSLSRNVAFPLGLSDFGILFCLIISPLLTNTKLSTQTPLHQLKSIADSVMKLVRILLRTQLINFSQNKFVTVKNYFTCPPTNVMDAEKTTLDQLNPL